MLYVFDIITYALITVQKLQINASGQLWPSRGIRRARRELNIAYASNVSKVAVVQVSTGQFLKKVIASSSALKSIYSIENLDIGQSIGLRDGHLLAEMR